MNTWSKYILVFCFISSISGSLFAQDCARDTIAPTIKCYKSTAGITLTNTRTSFGVSIKDFVTELSDNCTPSDQIVLSLDPSKSQSLIGVNCDAVGLHQDTLYAIDAAGNESTCRISYQVLDGANNCQSPEKYEVVGVFQNDFIPVEDIVTSIFLIDSLEQKTEFIPIEIKVEGSKIFIDLYQGKNPFPPKSQIAVSFFDISTDFDNGVSTLDVVTMIKHILGIEKLDQPEQILAADVNRDGKVTSLDVIEVRKIIIGITQTFSGNVSGVFYPDNILIPADQLPAQDIILSYVKLGDVNRTVY